MSNVTISDAIRYIGVDDKDIDLFTYRQGFLLCRFFIM